MLGVASLVVHQLKSIVERTLFVEGKVGIDVAKWVTGLRVFVVFLMVFSSCFRLDV